MRIFTAALAFLLLIAPTLRAAAVDSIADTLVEVVRKPVITPDSLAEDFAHLTRFVRHDVNGAVVFSDGGPTDGYVRHGMARFELGPVSAPVGGKATQFSIAIEFTDQPDFSYATLAAALEQRLGTPNMSSSEIGAVFRTWLLTNPAGRSLQLAKAQGSDNGDPVSVVYIIQNR